ncbi:MAG: translocation/assembly module TamB domain-containing protein [Acidobacteria bacterium]|nr:translocation/assembly module TamB domain-containing protein [Acidobacteriota bacterium]
MRRALAVLVAIVAGLLLLAGAALLVAHTPWVAGKVRERVVRELVRATGGEVELQAVRLRPLSLGAEVRGLRIEQGRGDLEQLVIAEGGIELSLTSLLAGRVQPTAIVADGLDIVIRAKPKPPGAPKAPPFDPTVLALLRSLSIAGGRLRYSEPDSGLAVDVSGIAMHGRPLAGGLGGDLVAGPVDVGSATIPRQHWDTFQAQWTWASPRLALSRFAAAGPGRSVDEGRASLGFTKTGAVLRGTAGGALELHEVIGEKYPQLSGPADYQVNFRLSVPGTWEVRGRVRSTGAIAWSGFEMNEVSALVHAAPGLVEASELRATASEGSTVEDGTFRQSGETWSLALAATTRADEAFRRLGLDPSFASGVARGELRAAVDAPDAPVSWRVSARVEAPAGDAVGFNGALEVEGGAQGGRVDYDGTWGAAALVLGVTWPAAGPAAAWTIDARLDAPPGEPARRTLAQLVAFGASEDLPVDSPLVPEPRGEFQLEAHAESVAGRVRRVEATGDFDEVAYGREAVQRLRGSFALRPDGGWTGTWTFHEGEDDAVILAGEALGEPGRDAIGLDLRAERMPLALAREISFRLGATPDDVPPLHGEFDGTARGTYSAAGGPELQLDLAARGHLAEAPDGTLTLQGVLHGGELTVAGADVALPGLEARYEGLLRLPEGARPFEADGALTASAAMARLAEAWGLGAMQGRVAARLAGKLSGLDDVPSLAGSVDWSELVLAGVRLPDGRADLEPREPGTRVVARTADLELRADLAGTIEAPGAEVTASWLDLELSTFLAQLAGIADPLPLALWSDGSAELVGPLLDPARWVGTVRLERLDVEGATMGARLEAPARLLVEAGGRVRIDPAAPFVHLGSGGGRLVATGSVVLGGEGGGQLALRLDGNIDLNALEVLSPDLLAAGQVELAADIGGTFGAPVFRGSATIDGGRMRWISVPQAADEIDLRLQLEGERVAVEGGFDLGGGHVALSGSLALEGWVPASYDLALRADDVAISLSDGLWTRFDGDGTLTGRAAAPELRGTLEIVAARYTLALGVGPGLPWQRVRTIAPAASEFDLLSRLGLRLSIHADETLSIRNEMGRIEASADLEIGGNAARPLVAGVVTFLEGSKFTMQDLEYEVVAGQVVMDDLRGEPLRLRLVADTQVGGYQIRLEIDASSEGLDYQVTSSPSLPQADILSLLITGRTLTETGETTTETVSSAGGSGAMPADLLTATFGTQLGELLLARPLRSVLGITKFEVSPTRAGPDARPTARVTIGRRIDPKTVVIYSRDLSVEGRDIYSIERELTRSARAVLGRDALGGTALDLRYLFRFGENGTRPEAPARARPPDLARVEIAGLPRGVDVRMSRDLELRRGDPLPRSLVVQAAESLHRKLIAAGYLESRVERAVELLPRRPGAPLQDPGERRAVLHLDVEAGPRWDVRYEVPEAQREIVQETLADLWAGTQFRRGEHRDDERLVERQLARDGHATAVAEILETGERKLRVVVDPGPRVSVALVAVRGAQAVAEEEILQQILSRPALGLGLDRVLYRPQVVEEDIGAIRTLYENNGYLETTIEPEARFRSNGEEVELTFVIDEGPRARIGSLSVEGNWPAELGPATERVRFRPGDTYNPAKVIAAAQRLREHLDDAGYYEGTVATRQTVESGQVDVVYEIHAGRPATIADVTVTGLDRTRRELVDRMVALHAGEPLSREKIRETERALFRLGLFRRVEIGSEALPDDPSRRKVTIRLEETPSVSLLTLVGYDTEQRFRVGATLSNSNLQGLGRTGSVQAFQSSIRRSLRGTIEDRHLARERLQGLLTAGVEEEEHDSFTFTSWGAAIQLGTPPRGQRVWLARYTLERTRFSELSDDVADFARDERLDANLRLGSVSGSYIRDRRDDPFLPNRGWIARTDLGLWAEPLASQADFVRWTGQLAGYWPWGGRTHLAASVRVGQAWPFGSTLSVPLSQRFFAGGVDSVRGYERDSLAATEEIEDAGGESMVIVNLEARYRLWNDIELVVFRDAGNVWLTASDIWSTGLRSSYGTGFRYRTSFGALRVEYGRKIDPREGESSGEFFFSIGEPF